MNIPDGLRAPVLIFTLQAAMLAALALIFLAPR